MWKKRWKTLPLVLVLPLLNVFTRCNPEDAWLNSEKDFASEDGCLYLSTSAANASTISSAYQVEAQEYSATHFTVVSCVNGECETYHFEREERF
ncbi:MAG: hypothetical protein ABDK94_02340 [Atribacterota bacterium]